MENPQLELRLFELNDKLEKYIQRITTSRNQIMQQMNIDKSDPFLTKEANLLNEANNIMQNVKFSAQGLELGLLPEEKEIKEVEDRYSYLEKDMIHPNSLLK